MNKFTLKDGRYKKGADTGAMSSFNSTPDFQIQKMEAKMKQIEEWTEIWRYVRHNIESNIIPPNHNSVWVTKYIADLKQNIINSHLKGFNLSFTDKQFTLLSRLKTDIETYKLILEKNK
jgi:hypothetical protein